MAFVSYQTHIKPYATGRDTLTIESLVNFEAAVDQLFEYFQQQGTPNLLEEYCPYFAAIWPAARGLAAHLASEQAKFLSGKTVLELGCGLGLPSLVASKCGARRVVATDMHPDCEEFLRRNCERNDIPPVEFVMVDWRQQDLNLGKFDYVIASDVLYDRQHAPSLAAFVARHIMPDGHVIISDQGRPYLQDFVTSMQDLGFKSETLIEPVIDADPIREVFVLKFVRLL